MRKFRRREGRKEGLLKRHSILSFTDRVVFLFCFCIAGTKLNSLASDATRTIANNNKADYGTLRFIS